MISLHFAIRLGRKRGETDVNFAQEDVDTNFVVPHRNVEGACGKLTLPDHVSAQHSRQAVNIIYKIIDRN